MKILYFLVKKRNSTSSGLTSDSKTIFTRDEATLEEGVSTRRSVRRPVGNAFVFRPAWRDLCRVDITLSDMIEPLEQRTLFIRRFF